MKLVDGSRRQELRDLVVCRRGHPSVDLRARGVGVRSKIEQRELRAEAVARHLEERRVERVALCRRTADPEATWRGQRSARRIIEHREQPARRLRVLDRIRNVEDLRHLTRWVAPQAPTDVIARAIGDARRRHCEVAETGRRCARRRVVTERIGRARKGARRVDGRRIARPRPGSRAHRRRGSVRQSSVVGWNAGSNSRRAMRRGLRCWGRWFSWQSCSSRCAARLHDGFSTRPVKSTSPVFTSRIAKRNGWSAVKC